MIIIFDTNPIILFFKKNETILSVLSLFTVLFGIFIAIPNPPFVMGQALLFIYFLLVMLYGIVIIDGISTGFINTPKSSSLIELLEYSAIVVISIILFVIIYLIGDFLFSTYYPQFAFAFYYFLFIVALYVLPNVLNFYKDKINSLYKTLVGIFLIEFFAICAIFLILQRLSISITDVKQGHTFSSSPEIIIPDIMIMIILAAIISNFPILWIQFCKKGFDLLKTV